jgi:MFS family permease
MLQAPTIPAFANELSPEIIRGRTNAWMSLQWTVSGVVGPAICGLMFGANLATQWTIVMFIGCFIPIPIYFAMHRALLKH